MTILNEFEQLNDEKLREIEFHDKNRFDGKFVNAKKWTSFGALNNMHCNVFRSINIMTILSNLKFQV